MTHSPPPLHLLNDPFLVFLWASMESNDTSLTDAAHAESVDEAPHAECAVDSAAESASPEDSNKVVQFPAGRFVRPPHRTTLPRRLGRGNGVVYMSAAVTKRNSLRFDPSPLLNDAPAPEAAPKRPRPETTIIFGPSAWQPADSWGLPFGGASFGGLNLPPTPPNRRDAFSLLSGRGSRTDSAQKAKPVLLLVPSVES